ncbi:MULTISPECIES: hypothetical protein [unclassified Rhodococcus (in: high G+C Gram-positive bacteria)]|uniref:hypothetical protein n=1 Tax=unclassified Rhodococcus (in: high G+C Gram-positive bacteria) TaxID=192944 RepID=UPI0011400500|nr:MULTISPECIES: hypothetical protein [unclassified Rhodococcus (in: high G+C Gram-positive bacteria)]
MGIRADARAWWQFMAATWDRSLAKRERQIEDAQYLCPYCRSPRSEYGAETCGETDCVQIARLADDPM